MYQDELGVVILNGKKYLMEFLGHSLKRTDQRLEMEDVKDFIDTLTKLSEEDFMFGRYGERLVVRDFFNNKSLVYSLDETDDFDFDRLDEAINFKDKITIVTLFYNAEELRQDRNQRVVVIDSNRDFVENEVGITYNDYIKWFKSTFKRMPSYPSKE